MEFNNPTPKTREELELTLNSNDKKIITESLVSLAFYEKDWLWAQNICLGFLENQDPDLSGLAATCLGHIARIHHKLDREKVRSSLLKKSGDPLIGGRVQDALDDIEIYL